jgi:hypothetical protein
MNIYVYDSFTINEYSEDDCGLILSSPIDVFDCGKISGSNDLFETENYCTVSNSETLYPFGSIKINSTDKVKYKKVCVEFITLDKISKRSILLTGVIITWYGYGTVFELRNGLERQVIPDVSGGGTAK